MPGTLFYVPKHYINLSPVKCVFLPSVESEGFVSHAVSRHMLSPKRHFPSGSRGGCEENQPKAVNK